MNPTLVTLEDWPLWPERCPADIDFVMWAEETGLSGNVIFHMGTGTHHLVGRQLGENNTVLGLTCCPAEMESYMSWAVENPRLSGRYRCLFGDLYVTAPSLLPKFNIMTFFHLFERPDERRAAYGAMTPEDTLSRLVSTLLARGGLVVSYAGSATSEQMEAALQAQRFIWAYDYRSLRFWRPWW